MADVKALAEELVNLSVKDVQELAKVLKEEYGIEPAAAAVAVAGPAAAAEAAPAEQTEFDVILKSAGAAKLIKKLQKEGFEKPVLKGAYVQECAFVGADKLEELASIKSKEELIGDIIGLLQSPARNVISALQSAGGTIAGLVKTLSEKEEK